MQVEFEERATGVIYTLTDPELNDRSIQIYPSSREQILTHHTGPVRGCFGNINADDGIDGERTFTLAASAVKAFLEKRVVDYYYFAGKSPLRTLRNLFDRGFDIDLPAAVRKYLDIFANIEREGELSSRSIHPMDGISRWSSIWG